ncbi:MAG: gamma-glutamylcyclotransferase family protein [Candidatus Hodarchaeales archaeon]
MNTNNIDSVFVYGTLMSKNSRSQTLRGHPFHKAILKGYKRIWPETQPFPIIIIDKESQVEGELYINLDAGTIEELDFVENEGSLYCRISVKVFSLVTREYVETYTYYPSESLIQDFIGKQE